MNPNTTYFIKRLLADQVSNDTTQAAIAELVAALEKNEIYKYKLTLLVIGKAADDVDVSLTGPSGSVLTYGLDGVNPKVSVGAAELMVALTDDLLSVVIVEGIITVGSTAGNLSPLFGMTTDVSTLPLTAKAGSSLEVWQISATT
jgi:hypothetical protein